VIQGERRYGLWWVRNAETETMVAITRDGFVLTIAIDSATHLWIASVGDCVRLGLRDRRKAQYAATRRCCW
jgi:hypothetical protein